MPRASTGRVPVTVKISPEGLRLVDVRAKAADVDRSEMIRRMLKFAEAKMPRQVAPNGATDADAS